MCVILLTGILLCLAISQISYGGKPAQRAMEPLRRGGLPVEGCDSRKPSSEAELQYWLQNMVWNFGFTVDEIEAATGLSEQEINSNLQKFQISYDTKPARAKNAPLLLAPYPGGRAISNYIKHDIGIERTRQRDTQAAVFTPWDDTSYVVLDCPEALHSSIGYLYLAHNNDSYVKTIWRQKNIELEKLEWDRRKDGCLKMTRKLPNGVIYTATLVPFCNAIRMKLTLTNGTDSMLTGLGVQNCVFLRGLKGYDAESDTRTLSSIPYSAARSSADGTRWAIQAWAGCSEPWNNPNNPCYHADRGFENCSPGQTQAVYGWFSFYQGKDIKGELERIDKTGWKEDKWKDKPGWNKYSKGYR